MSLKTLRSEALGASTLTAAELRLLPRLAAHLDLPRDRRTSIPVAPHREVTGDCDLPQAVNVTSRNAAVERARELGLL